jgi:hypothetical protein
VRGAADVQVAIAAADRTADQRTLCEDVQGPDDLARTTRGRMGGALLAKRFLVLFFKKELLSSFASHAPISPH